MLPGEGDIDDDPALTVPVALSAALEDVLSDVCPLKFRIGMWTVSPLDSLPASSPSSVPPSDGIVTLERDLEAPRIDCFDEGGRGVRARERARSWFCTSARRSLCRIASAKVASRVVGAPDAGSVTIPPVLVVKGASSGPEMRGGRAKYEGGSLIGMGFEVEAKAAAEEEEEEEEDGAGLRARTGEGGRYSDGVGGRWEGRAAAPVLGGR